jgi:hypothetical protein
MSSAETINAKILSHIRNAQFTTTNIQKIAFTIQISGSTTLVVNNDYVIPAKPGVLWCWAQCYIDNRLQYAARVFTADELIAEAQRLQKITG